MAMPKFFDCFYPILHFLVHADSLRIRDLREQVATYMHVTQEERDALLPSGTQRMFDNRVNWATTFLKKAGLIENSRKGLYHITSLGKNAYQEVGDRIDLRYLGQFESFREFTAGKAAKPEDNGDMEFTTKEQTPQDTLETAFRQINDSLADELLLTIMDRTPRFFEKLVVDLLLKMGYGGAFEGAGLVTGQSGDEGIDGMIREDKLGFSSIYIQAKRWDVGSSISRPEVQKFVGALAGQGAQKGLFITTAQFSKDARSYVQKQLATKIVLVDGAMLTKLMIEYDVGVSIVSTYQIKRIDTDFFTDDDI